MKNPSIFQLQGSDAFQKAALETYAFQYANQEIYQAFCNHLGKSPDRVRDLAEIPFLPISFFKTHRILSRGMHANLVFHSSGTTGMVRSTHHVADPSLYRASFLAGFERVYGPVDKLRILALLPSYQAQPGSSLIYMVDALIRRSGIPESGYLSGPPQSIAERLKALDATGVPTLLIGVSYALLNVALQAPVCLTNTIVMETGGMKGRGKELVREALHRELSTGFGVPNIHSEYGMTELLSQAYSEGEGIFRCPPWMQIRVRDTEDPLSEIGTGRTGGINVIDLANRYSCSFIATQDLGKRHPDCSFEILGRFDHSDIRGCNLLAL